MDIKPRLDRGGTVKAGRACRDQALRIAIPLSAIIVLGATLALIVAYESGFSDDADSKPVKRMTYVSRGPIGLFGNSWFEGDNSTTGISWGSGTEEDPYIITGWEIDAMGNQSAIEIFNSDVHFKVTNCILYNASDQDILIRFSSNGSLINNYCNESMFGIRIWWSDNMSAVGNSCNNNSWQGICLSWSENVTAFNNTCNSNDDSGIFVSFSNDNSISNNLCYDNPLGMRISNSRRTEIAYNNLSSNSGVGVSIDVNSRDNRLWNNTFYHNNGTGNIYDPFNSQAFDMGTNNSWNTNNPINNYGNYWRDMTSPDSSAPFGIVDVPYNISGGKGAKDYFPLTTMPTPPMIPEPAIIILAPIMAAVFIIVRRMSGQRGSQHEEK